MKGIACEKELLVAKKHWKEKRNGQGHSYDEVFAEIKRRFDGERIFTEAEARRRFAEGVKKLALAYQFSAHVLDFLEKKGMTYKDVLKMIGTQDEDCTLALFIDPVSLGDRHHSLRNDGIIDCYYPGEDLPEGD